MTPAQLSPPDPVSPWDFSPLKLIGAIVVVVLIGVASLFGLAFYLTSSLVLPSCACVPYELGMVPNGTSNPAAGLYYEALEVSPTSGLTTGMFGLAIVRSTGSGISSGVAPNSCAPPVGGTLTPFTLKNCGAPSGNWYAVLVFENTTIQGVFDSRGHWSGPTALLERSSDQIYVISDASYAGIETTIFAYSTDGASVSGACSL
jgi:hypothetical protein